jgi:CRP/FNR family transcriptional regulator, cyclic AMP receptor protein
MKTITRRRVRKNQRVALLREIELFSACSKSELERIASLTTEYSVAPGQIITERDEPGSEFFVIVEGIARATREGNRLADLGPGSFFGEMALLDGGTRSATVVSASDMKLLVLSRREFMSLQHVAPPVANKMLAEVGSRLRKADEMLVPASA